MKILFYINTLGRGGAERVISNLAGVLSEDTSNEVILVTSKKVDLEYELNPKVRRIVLLEDGCKARKIKRNMLLIKSLRATLKSELVDIAVAFTPEPNFRLLLAARNLKIKTIVSVRNDPKKEYPNAVYKLLANVMYKRATRIVFQTPDAQNCFPASIRKKSLVIMNQVNDKFYSTQINENGKDIITLGRLTEQKNHKLLIEAFSEIKDEISENLVIYGEGPLRKELEQLVNDLGLQNRVFLPGNTDDAAHVLSNAKIFVLPSDYEGMPNALLEALATGLPCISTDCPCGGPKMVINNNENGILVPIKDKNALSSAIKTLVINQEQANKLGANAKASAKMFSPDAIISEWKKCLFD